MHGSGRCFITSEPVRVGHNTGTRPNCAAVTSNHLQPDSLCGFLEGLWQFAVRSSYVGVLPFFGLLVRGTEVQEHKHPRFRIESRQNDHGDPIRLRSCYSRAGRPARSRRSPKWHSQRIDHGFEKRLRTRIEKHGTNSKVSGMINTSFRFTRCAASYCSHPGVTVSPHELDFLANNREPVRHIRSG